MLSIVSLLDFVHLNSKNQSTTFSGVASSTPVFKLGVPIQLDLIELMQITGLWWKVHYNFFILGHCQHMYIKFDQVHSK
jgi:hypothetical protein